MNITIPVLIPSDEIWVFKSDPEFKHKRSEWHTDGSPRRKKEARKSISQVKGTVLAPALLRAIKVVKGHDSTNPKRHL